MIYLVKDNDKVLVFYSETEMKAAGFTKAGLTVDEEKFNANGCYARLIDGRIVVGKTEAEITEEARQEKITDYLEQLEEIDRKSGAGRHVRDVSVSAGVALDAVRIIIAQFAKGLNIQMPADFGIGCATAADMIALQPPAGATAKEKEDFQVYKSLLILSHFDPAINPGLSKLREAEIEAAPVRVELAKLLA